MTTPTLAGKCAKRLPVCGVYAVAYMANVPLDEVFQFIKKRQKKKAHWKGRTYWRDQAEALTKYGLKFTPHPFQKMTLERFVDDTMHMKKIFLVDTGGHTQVVEGDKITDQKGTIQIEGYWGRRKRIKRVHIIERRKT